MKTECCSYEIDPENPVIKWNEFNGVVQCHQCGQVYMPQPQENKPDTEEGKQ